MIRDYLGDDFDMSHFTPSYRPWQQRLAYVPDGDLFEAIKSGKVSVVTDHIDRFTPDGILTKSGELLEADIIITATGFDLCPCGRYRFRGEWRAGELWRGVHLPRHHVFRRAQYGL